MAKSLSEMSSDELVEELLKLKLQELQSLDPRSKEFKDAMSAVTDLYKAQTDSYKLNVEADYKKFEVEKEKKSTLWDWILRAVGIGAPIALYGILWHKGMQFEQEGTYSSSGMRRLNNDLKLKF